MEEGGGTGLYLKDPRGRRGRPQKGDGKADG